MRELIFNLYDSHGILHSIERWTKTDNGYLVEIRYCQEFEIRDFVEAKPNLLYDRELVCDDETFEFDTTSLSKEDQIKFMMLLNSGVKIKVVSQE